MLRANRATHASPAVPILQLDAFDRLARARSCVPHTGRAADALGRYTGRTTGVWSTLTAGGALTMTTEAATLDVDITGVAGNAPRGRTLSGTVSVAFNTAQPIALRFTGVLRLNDAAGRVVSGGLLLTAESLEGERVALSLTLAGSLADGTLIAHRLIVADHANSAGGFAFLAPATRIAEPIELRRTTDTRAAG